MALTAGAFGTGSTEFAIMGLLPEVAADLVSRGQRAQAMALQSGVSYAQLPWVGAALALVAFGMGFLARAQDRKYAHRTASARKAAMFAH